jgi:hypothetical protein
MCKYLVQIKHLDIFGYIHDMGEFLFFFLDSKSRCFLGHGRQAEPKSLRFLFRSTVINISAGQRRDCGYSPSVEDLWTPAILKLRIGLPRGPLVNIKLDMIRAVFSDNTLMIVQ